VLRRRGQPGVPERGGSGERGALQYEGAAQRRAGWPLHGLPHRRVSRRPARRRAPALVTASLPIHSLNECIIRSTLHWYRLKAMSFDNKILLT
jgi:hypothetical protein